MSEGNGVSAIREPARDLVAYIIKHHMREKQFSPMVRHSLRVAFGRMPTSQPVDRCIVTLLRLGREAYGVTEREFLLQLMQQCGRVAPVSYPDDDNPEYQIAPDGTITWQAAVPPPKVLSPGEPEEPATPVAHAAE